MRKRLIFKLLIGLVVVIAAAVLVLPWKAWLEQKLVAAIEQKGIRPVALSIDTVGIRGITLKDVTLGDPPLKLQNLTVSYQLGDAIHGRIEDVTLRGLILAAQQSEAGWNIVGLEALLKPDPEAAPSKTEIPVTAAEIAALPLRSIGIEESTLEVNGQGWQAQAPVTLKLQQTEPVTLTLESGGIQATQGDNQITSGKLQVTLMLDEATKQWKGDWSIADIAYAGEAAAIPHLQAKGTLNVEAERVLLKGTVSDAAKQYRGEVTLDYALNDPARSFVAVSNVQLPWGGGMVGVSNAKLPLDGKKATRVNLSVKQVEVASLLRALTDQSANATGVVSGALPLIIQPNGEVRIGKGALKAEAPGTINVSPDAIPGGDNAQVALVRDVLKNLHYNLLALELDMAPDNTLSVLLAVEGSNPEVQGGRAIKLKVHLSGDVLDLIKQNVKLMTDPKSFIEQERHD